MDVVNPDKPILFYDGGCRLCDPIVVWLLKVDKRANLCFAPLQGRTAKRFLPAELTEDLQTVVLYKEGRLLERSDAVIETLVCLGGTWKLFALLKLVPRFLRNGVYELVSKLRNPLFGRYEESRISLQVKRPRFLP